MKLERLKTDPQPVKDLRDEFAMAALPMLMKVLDKYGNKHGVTIDEIDVAESAYDYADAMLEARSNNK